MPEPVNSAPTGAQLLMLQGDLVSAQKHLEELMQLDARYAAQFRGFHAIVTKKLEAERR